MSSIRASILVLVFTLVTSNSPVAGQQAEGKKYALLVGINRYDFQAHFPDLHGAVNDAVVLGKLLKQQGYEVALLTDEKATRKNIEAELAKIKMRATRADLILIGLAGHGELIGADSYFCPREARAKEKDTLLALNALCKELDTIKGKAKLVLVDACRDDGRGAVDAAGVPAQVGLLFSCSPGQRAFETKDKKHGVFFQHVIRGMEGAAKNAKGEVTWAGLRAYVIDHVPDAVGKESPGAKQTPHDIGNVAGVPALAAATGKQIKEDLLARQSAVLKERHTTSQVEEDVLIVSVHSVKLSVNMHLRAYQELFRVQRRDKDVPLRVGFIYLDGAEHHLVVRIEAENPNVVKVREPTRDGTEIPGVHGVVIKDLLDTKKKRQRAVLVASAECRPLDNMVPGWRDIAVDVILIERDGKTIDAKDLLAWHNFCRGRNGFVQLIPHGEDLEQTEQLKTALQRVAQYRK